jgi:osmotically-inducible protein OsmY
VVTNEELQKNIYAELKWDPSVNASDIGVTVKDRGVVTLSGTVPYYADKWAAEQATTRVVGVKVVAEEIEVKLSKSHELDDTELGESIARALAFNILVPKQVKAKIENGWVTLRGAVNWDYEKRNAEESIKKIAGVRGIANLISLRPSVKPQDVRIKIKSALERMADIDADNISIKTYGGKVTLSGRVHSYNESEEARSAAWRTPGVISVKNELRVAL